MTTGSTGSTFPRWQLALLIGAPVAIGLGYLYWRKSSDQGEGSDKLTKKKLADIKDKTISLDGDSSEAGKQQPDAKPLSGRELALKHKNNGNAHFRAGKYDLAISEYDAAIEHCPTFEANDRSTYYQNRAAAYEQLQNWAAVIKDCTNAIECNPSYTKALVRRAKAYEQQKDLTKALEDITAACIVDQFQSKTTLVMADRMLRELGQQHGKEAMKNKKEIYPSKQFIDSYFSSFTNDPVRKLVVASSEPKGFIKAKMLFDKGDYEAIVAACTEEIESSESESEYKLEALVLRGTMYNLIACYDEAKQDLDAVIELETADKRLRTNALIKRASLAMQTQPETPGACFEYFARAEAIDSTNGDIFHHRGQVYILSDRMNDAIADFERAYGLCPTSGIIATHLCYAKYCQAVQNKDESGVERMKKRFNELLEEYANCVECYSILAQVLTEQQNFAEADSCFARALKVDPNQAQIYVHRGVLQLQWKGDFDEGVKLIKKAIEMDSKCELAYETLGTIEVQRGNLAEAVKLFERAIELARTEMTLVHLYSLKDAAVAQLSVAKNMGLSISNIQPNF
ncbi:mitochondrial import receptor subunit TOM70 [Anopheles funestus]|uniref:mitochondrial import receptor subunit TOM70 n=1 Tax=Anopheles funestus TaxID=62324 RepID=UPI0020C6E997|nr:mitochondrial import receptor subunit TOM70 [Anopheles funestus]